MNLSQNKISEFLKFRNIKNINTFNAYKTDLTQFYEWFSCHKNISENNLYEEYFKNIKEKYSNKENIHRKKVLIGDFLIFCGIYPSNDYIVLKTKNNKIQYISTKENELFYKGKQL